MLGVIRLRDTRNVRTGDAGAESAGTRPRVSPLLVFLAALLLFAPGVFWFNARVIDLGAMRVLQGAVPYRDFWTMYSPGTFYIDALVFWLLGRQLIVSNALGILVSAAAVAVFYRVGTRVLTPVGVLLASAIFAVAFAHTPYHIGLASYPAAILCICLAVDRLANHARTERRRDIAWCGVFLGLAILCKHDLGGYASIAATAALWLTKAPRKVANTGTMILGAVVVVAPAVVMLLAAGAGPDMYRDLVTWPTGDFRIVRPDYFPYLPPLWRGSILSTIASNLYWSILQVPVIAVVAALLFLWRDRRSMSTEQWRILLFAALMLPLVWTAAHVQVNTHAVTLPALGALVGLAGLLGTRGAPPAAGRAWRAVVVAACVCWSLLMFGESMQSYYQNYFPRPEALRLPHLAGIYAPDIKTQQLRGLHDAIAAAAPANAPLLMVAERNDIVIHAQGQPYWLSDRRMITRHEELHPGITDTEEYQRQMLADIEAGPLPVIVVEHRFPAKSLDRWLKRFQAQGVRAGSMLLDDWLKQNYRAGPRFGMYEVLQRR